MVLLGTVEVDGVTVGSVRLRTLLAHLALAPGRAVSGGALVDGCYGTALPQRPAAALQVLVTRLRKRFTAAPTSLVASAGGYVLRLDDDEVDLVRFLRAAADALDPESDGTIDAARRAVELWGEPFPGCLPSERLGTVAVQAHERFLRVLERLADACLERDAPGDAEAAVEAVLPHLASHRDREPLVAAAMRALHRLGRTVEALAAFAETRRALRVEHGVDPGPALRELEATLLAAPRRGTRRREPVVGRSELLAAVRARLDDVERGAVVIALGEAGIGKTSLLRAARDEARVRGAVVGSGAWNEADTPLTAWSEGLHDLGTPVPTRDPEFGRAVHRALRRRAADAPLLLTLDDAHRADSASLGTLLSLARRGLPPGIVVLVAAREPDAVAHPRWEEIRADLVRLPGVHELPVRELDRAAVAELLERRGRPDDEAAGSLWTRSAGHPLHLAALLDTLDDEGTDPTVPDRLRPLLAYQLARLPADCREVLEALAVLAPISADALAEVLGTEVRRVLQALRPAADLGLVAPDGAGYAFRHELTAAAAAEPVPGPERSQLHRTRLGHLDTDAEPFERLRHAVGAATMVAPHVVADARVAAAATARERGALAEALALLDAADDASDPCAVQVDRGLVLQALGRLDESDDVLDAVVADPATSVSALVDAAVGADAVGISVAGRPRRLARLQRIRDLPLDRRDRVRVLRALIVEQQQFLGDAEADAMPDLLALAAASPDDPRLQAEVALLRGNQLADEPVVVRERIRHAERAHGLAVATGERELRLEAEELLVASLLAAGRVDDAEALGSGLRATAERHRHARSIWACLLVEASLLAARGEAEAADAAAEQARDRGLELGIPDAFGAYGVHLASTRVLAGTLPSLNGLPAGAAAFYPHVAAWSAVAAADAAQAGDAVTAAEHLTEWTRRREGRPYRLFDRSGLCCAAVAAFAVGDERTAREVLAGLPADPEAVLVIGIGAGTLGPVSTYQGLALLAAGEPEPARQAFKVAADVAGRLGWTPWADAAVTLGRWAETGSGPLPFGVRRL
ncbi:BTAD domain-containing putative transcriptional regulator [Actinomycetospora chiangmaiensis]|uniref:BTAD domain-containing putative transcriptional regulator n=1 Tax=Actinomycetospora chiangmaiensis TaxID=402650 RepID=UPI00035F3A59|nr:BTAD domain-containing putative transcriptional regulator [Actinomycetospora chiangmaiensis]